MSDLPTASARPARRKLALRLPIPHPIRKGAYTLGAMVAGSLVGFGVQIALQQTGLAGPSVESLIAEQDANFAGINTKLEALKGIAQDPQVKQTVTELADLLRRQATLSQQASEELRTLSQQSSAAKDKQLSETGMAGGADFWLKPGESVNVGGREQVFGVLAYARGLADVNFTGTRKRLSVGDTMQVKAGGKTCNVFYKQATPRSDGRLGFDLNCVETTG